MPSMPSGLSPSELSSFRLFSARRSESEGAPREATRSKAWLGASRSLLRLSGRLGRRHGLILLAFAVIAACGAAIAFDVMHSRKKALKSDSHAWLRTGTINAHLRQVEADDYALLVGDSHIEQLFLPTLCDLPTVNAGISGATSDSYRAALERFRFARPPALVVLTIGTNDGNLRRVRESGDFAASFRRSSGKLIDDLMKLTPRLVVTAVPPLDPKRVGSEFSAEIMEQISGVLAEQCRSKSCVFVDPFDEARSALFDGIHLVNAARSYKGLAETVCGASAKL